MDAAAQPRRYVFDEVRGVVATDSSRRGFNARQK